MIFKEQFISEFSAGDDEVVVDDFQRQLSRRELFERAAKLASYLAEQGLGVDEHIAVLVSNRTEYVEIVLASVLAGVWLTPINWHLTESEINYVLEDCGCRLLIIEDRFESLFADINAGSYSLLRIGAEYEAALQETVNSAWDSESLAGGVMMYTSGTTGRPKGVKRTRPGSINKTLAAWASTGMAIGLDGSGPHLITGPMYHAAPLLYAFYDLLNGASLILMPAWDAEKALSLIESYRVVHTHFVPTMFTRCLRGRSDFKRDYDLSSLTMVLHGAAPIGVQLKQDIHNWWGDSLVEYWGGTESGIVTRVTAAQWREHPGTVGRPLPQFEVFAVDDSGQRLSVGEIGMLYIYHKHSDKPFTYHRDKEKTAASYLGRGTFTLGDLGYVDDEGYVYLSDRRSNLIISGGVNIYPAEIEQVLSEHPAVIDIAVFGLPDDEWGQTVQAAVELDPAYSKDKIVDELKAFAELKLARFKLPRRFYVIDKLPRYESGKLYLSRLRKILALE